MSKANSGLSIQDAINLYLLYCRSMGREEGTIRWHSASLNRFAKWAKRKGKTELADITRHDIRAYWLFLQENYKGVATAASSVRAFFHWLVAEGERQDNPVKQAGMPKRSKKMLQPLTAREVESLVLAAARRGRNKKRDMAVILLLYDTGLRISEALDIRLKDVDFQNGQVTVHGKMDKTRTVSFSYRVTRALLDYSRHERPNSHEPFLFLSDDGAKLTRRAARWMLRRQALRAGVEPERASPHRFRHSFAVAFLRNGGSALHLQALLGHASLEMTRRYVMFSGVDLRAAHQKHSPVARMRSQSTDDW